MSYGAFGMGCGCNCESCSFGADDFTVDDLATAWTATSSVAIAGGTLNISSDSKRAIWNTAHPDSESSMVVDVDFNRSVGGSAACDVIVGYVDSSNWFYVRYKAAGASGTIDIRKNVAGTHSSILIIGSITINTGTTYHATVCVNDRGQITASLDGVAKLTSATLTIGGTQAALGSSGGGTSAFDNFTVSKSHAASTAESCTACQSAYSTVSCGSHTLISANAIRLDVAGFITNGTNGNANCDTIGAFDYCLGFNGSYDLTPFCFPVPPAGYTQCYCFEYSNTCTYLNIHSTRSTRRVVGVCYDGSGNLYLYATLYFQDGDSPPTLCQQHYWYLSAALPVNGLGYTDPTGITVLSYLTMDAGTDCCTHPATITVEVT